MCSPWQLREKSVPFQRLLTSPAEGFVASEYLWAIKNTQRSKVLVLKQEKEWPLFLTLNEDLQDIFFWKCFFSLVPSRSLSRFLRAFLLTLSFFNWFVYGTCPPSLCDVYSFDWDIHTQIVAWTTDQHRCRTMNVSETEHEKCLIISMGALSNLTIFIRMSYWRPVGDSIDSAGQDPFIQCGRGSLFNELSIRKVKQSVVRIFRFVSKQTRLLHFLLSARKKKEHPARGKLICCLSKGQAFFVCTRARLHIIVSGRRVFRASFVCRCFSCHFVRSISTIFCP